MLNSNPRLMESISAVLRCSPRTAERKQEAALRGKMIYSALLDEYFLTGQFPVHELPHEVEEYLRLRFALLKPLQDFGPNFESSFLRYRRALFRLLLRNPGEGAGSKIARR